VFSLPSRRTPLLAIGALVLAIGVIAFAFIAGTTRVADAQFARPHASVYLWTMKTFTISSRQYTTVRIDCPFSGSPNAIAVGYRSLSNEVVVGSSYPAGNFHGWELDAATTRPEGTPSAFYVYLECTQ
jgi:hypothetical protein